MIELLKLKQINLILKDINNILSNRKKQILVDFKHEL
jgi:hypothetical protein